MSTEPVEAATLVDLIRSQNWKNGGVMMIDRDDAIALVETALRVSRNEGVIEGMEKMGKIADDAFARSIPSTKRHGGSIVGHF